MQPICSNYFNHLQPSKIACKNMILLHSESWRNSNSAQKTVELHVQAALHNLICTYCLFHHKEKSRRML